MYHNSINVTLLHTSKPPEMRILFLVCPIIGLSLCHGIRSMGYFTMSDHELF